MSSASPMHPRHWLFYGIVAAITACDNAVLTGVIWISLKLSGSTIPLGVVLCCSVGLPFALELLSRGRTSNLPPMSLTLLRICAFGLAALLAVMQAGQVLAGFLVIALLVGLVDYLSATALETENTRRVAAGHIHPDSAARYMQTAIQIGGFGGSLAGGILLGLIASTTFLWVVTVLGALVSPLLLLSRDRQPVASIYTPVKEDSSAGAASTHPAPALPFVMPWAWLACLALIGAHIGAFNSMLPLVYQRVHEWSATSFGAASGMAGAGAFLAAVLPARQPRLVLHAALLVLVDVLMVFAPLPALSLAGAFFVGFTTNHLRIVVRGQVMRHAHTDDQAVVIGNRSAFSALSMQAAVPLLLVLATSPSMLGTAAGPALMVTMGGFTALGMTLAIYWQRAAAQRGSAAPAMPRGLEQSVSAEGERA